MDTTDADSIAVIDRLGAVSYGELMSHVARVRDGLRTLGVRPGDAVLLITANERESVFAYHGVVAAGAVAVLSHASAGASELAYACSATTPRLAVLSPGAAMVADRVPKDILLTSVDHLAGDTTDDPDVGDPDAPAVIVFTSGTTATPKGVVHTKRSLRTAVMCFRAMTGLEKPDRLFLVSPLASITGVLQALELAPTVGAAAVLEQSWGDEASLDFLTAAGATFYGGPDLLLDRLLRVAARRGQRVPLRLAALGGAAIHPELVEIAEQGFGIKVVRVYGSSEAPCSTGSRPDEEPELRLVDEGRPGPGVELRIADDGSGELLVRGPHLFTGYLDPNDTGTALAGGWFHTGDAAEIVDGRLRITGRLKEVAIRDGRKISLAEVELAFATAAGGIECAAFTAPDATTGERVTMAVTVDDLDIPRILEAMKGAGMAPWKLPESVVWVEMIPTSVTGKVQRQRLRSDSPELWKAARLRTSS